MKRVKAACICQTLHFGIKEDTSHDFAVRQVEQEVEQYKKNPERSHTQIVEQTRESDGSIIVKMII